MNENIVEFVESSFLKPLLEIPNITDVSYNGSDIYYVTNDYGRQKYPQKIEEKVIYDFLRQIVNLTDSQFSFSKPILDVSIGRYRFNATHFAMTRKFRERAINFSLRIGYDGVRIHEDDGFINKKCLKLVDLFIENKLSIVIGGKTGCGKTEFQKFLISRLKDNSRVIVIDNLNEIENDEFKPNLDIQTWVVNEMHEGFTFDNFIKNALRSHPDWIVLSESRGKEMLSILNSAMSGHPTITTLHTKDCKSIYSRMARMCLQNGDNLKYKEVLEDIFEHFKLAIYVSRSEDMETGKITRYIDSISTNYKGVITQIYTYPNKYKRLPKQFLDILNLTSAEKTLFNQEWVNEEK